MARNLEPVQKTQRWDESFGIKKLSEQMIKNILILPVFREINPGQFPADLPLGDILANDAEVHPYKQGEVIYQNGDYETSIYFVLSGAVREELDFSETQKQSKKNSAPFKKTIDKFFQSSLIKKGQTHQKMLSGAKTSKVVQLYNFFGVSEALTRSVRQSTMVADDDRTLILELKWSGVRALRQWSDTFRESIDTLHERRSILISLMQCPLLSKIDNDHLDLIASHSNYASFGQMDWGHGFQKEKKRIGNDVDLLLDYETLITPPGGYLDDLMIIASGFVRVTEEFDFGEKTTGYLQTGDVAGLDEIVASLMGKGDRILRYGLRAMGYVGVIQIPTYIVEKYIIPQLSDYNELKRNVIEMLNDDRAPLPNPEEDHKQALTDFAINDRLVNGTMAMAINTDRCVNCDDCLKACAATHNNLPRFNKHEGYTVKNLKIANACMHCVDPVCLVDCPTNAIHRDKSTGNVIINEETCIGCTSCANACPYNNITMETLRDHKGAFVTDNQGIPLVKAIKCDLCIGQAGGPACQEACSHDALVRIDIKNIDKLSDWLA